MVYVNLLEGNMSSSMKWYVIDIWYMFSMWLWPGAELQTGAHNKNYSESCDVAMKPGGKNQWSANNYKKLVWDRRLNTPAASYRNSHRKFRFAHPGMMVKPSTVFVGDLPQNNWMTPVIGQLDKYKTRLNVRIHLLPGKQL